MNDQPAKTTELVCELRHRVHRQEQMMANEHNAIARGTLNPEVRKLLYAAHEAARDAYLVAIDRALADGWPESHLAPTALPTRI